MPGGMSVATAVAGAVGLSAADGALDFAGRRPFHIALVNDTLPDLTGITVARSLLDLTDEGLILLFAHPLGEKIWSWREKQSIHSCKR